MRDEQPLAERDAVGRRVDCGRDAGQIRPSRAIVAVEHERHERGARRDDGDAEVARCGSRIVAPIFGIERPPVATMRRGASSARVTSRRRTRRTHRRHRSR
jgi:hypothetical protein